MDDPFTAASPIVVIGMHRSGTRLLAQILERLGVFMGADQQADSESVSFMLVNEGLLHQCGAFWSEPMSAHFLMFEHEVVERLAGIARDTLRARLPAYLGVPAAAAGTTHALPPLCGWKDPRNTFTLPVWRRVFPELRVVHLLRHGVDVAASLSRRHSESLRAASGQEVPPALTVIRDHGLGVLSSRRGWTLEEALTMWEQYVEKARLEASDLGERALEIRFEDLLRQPDPTLRQLARFCRAPAVERDDSLLERIEAGRAYAYRRNPALIELAKSARAVLERYGYPAD